MCVFCHLFLLCVRILLEFRFLASFWVLSVYNEVFNPFLSVHILFAQTPTVISQNDSFWRENSEKLDSDTTLFLNCFYPVYKEIQQNFVFESKFPENLAFFLKFYPTNDWNKIKWKEMKWNEILNGTENRSQGCDFQVNFLSFFRAQFSDIRLSTSHLHLVAHHHMKLKFERKCRVSRGEDFGSVLTF